jgi:Selenocysteine lyase
VRIGDQHPVEASRALADRGIFTWDGPYYAIEVFDRLGLLDSGGAVRIGFCHYHTLDEVDRGARCAGGAGAVTSVFPQGRRVP